MNLTHDSRIYTSNVYMVLGTWNAIEDVNTLIDVGRDASVIEKIKNAATGVGKKRLDQVKNAQGLTSLFVKPQAAALEI